MTIQVFRPRAGDKSGVDFIGECGVKSTDEETNTMWLDGPITWIRPGDIALITVLESPITLPHHHAPGDMRA